MKKSGDSPEPLDLERDLPTTSEDVAVQKRLRETAPRMTYAEYFEFLAQFHRASPEDFASRRGPRGDRLFELP